MDYYQTLGVNRSATDEEIRRAYKKLVKENHPDIGGDPEHFKKINEAYNALSNQTTRQTYSFNQNNVDEFYDLFKNVFGASTGFHHSEYTKPKNKDLRAVIEVDLKSILHAQSRTLHLKTGRSEKTVDVEIPAGVNDGATIRYRGYGQDILTQVSPGDLLVTVKVHNNKNFQRQGSDLHSEITIDAFDAMLGSTVEFVNIDESCIQVKIPAGIQPGKILRIASKGLPQVNNNLRGNLLLTVKITIPENLTSDQKNQLYLIKNQLTVF